jgi:hypothetical protein
MRTINVHAPARGVGFVLTVPGEEEPLTAPPFIDPSTSVIYDRDCGTGKALEPRRRTSRVDAGISDRSARLTFAAPG